MSKLSKIALLVSGLSLAILLSTRYLIGGWTNFMWIFLALFLAGFVAALVIDIKVIIEFLSMRTTKHGMNMGAMILLVVALLVSINFLGHRFNKTFDLTEEKINSLAPQSKDLLKNLKDDITIKIFYVESEQSTQLRQQVSQNLELYKENTSKLKIKQINAYVDNVQSQAYLNSLPDKDREQIFVFAEYKNKRIRVEAPFAEEQITAAFIKATRDASKNIYFVTGHGEKSLDSENPDGLKAFHDALSESSFVVHSLNLAEKGSVPQDADIVAIIGPVASYLDVELDALRTYARNGGRLLIALDPGQKHNLALLTKSLGVEFQNNFVIDVERVLGRGSALALGIFYDPSHEITKPFSAGYMSLFDLASELKIATDGNGELKAVDLVKTPESSFTINELVQTAQKGDARSMSLAVAVSGKMKPAPQAEKVENSTTQEFASVIFGDSDFLANKSILQGLNKDLAMNSLAYLAREMDLISIRPKQLKGTKMVMTQTVSFIVVIAGLALPLSFLILSGVLWFRRRGA